MKIVCDSCATKYSISDDKVRGKVFKIRCKKCSHIIVVRGTGEGAAAAAPEAPSEAVWHLVVDGEQVGPLTDGEVRTRLSRGDVSSENYIWKEGFADWLKLGAIPDFADALPPQPAASGELYSNGGAPAAVAEPADVSAGFFGGGVAGQEARAMASASGGTGQSGPTSTRSGRTRSTAASVAAAPAAAQPAPEDDAFSAPAGAGFGGADLFGAAAPAAEPARPRGTNGTASAKHDGGRIESLTAQRSENSVLFSLSNLHSLAAPAMAKPTNEGASPSGAPSGGPTPGSEGSGLIDIRAMAASTLKGPAPGMVGPMFGESAGRTDDELPAFGSFSSGAPVLLPLAASSGPPKWVYALIGVAVLLILALVGAALMILKKPVVAEAPPPAPVPVAAPPAAAAPDKKAGEKAPEAPESKPMNEADLPPREGGTAAAAESGEKAKGGGKRPGKGGAKKGEKVAGGDKPGGGAPGAPVAAAPAASPEPENKPAKGSLDDLLDRALNKKGEPRVKDDGGGKKAADKGGDRGAPEPASAGPLAKGAVVAGMNAIKPKISACYTQFKVPGMVMVKVAIGKKGKVDAATATGKFAGTPSGACVEQAVRTATFPPSDGLSTEYPFNLR